MGAIVLLRAGSRTTHPVWEGMVHSDLFQPSAGDRKLIYPSSSQIYPAQLHLLIQVVGLTNSAQHSSKFAINRKESVLTPGQRHVMDAVLFSTPISYTGSF